MKAILYVGAALMTSAIIYGFVDYRETSRSKNFNSMYDQTDPAESVAVIPETKTEAVTEKMNSKVKKEPVAVKRSGIKIKKETLTKSSGRDVIPVIPVSIEKKEEALPVLKDEKTESAIKEIKTKKRLNIRMYSRAALKEIPAEKKTKSKKQ